MTHHWREQGATVRVIITEYHVGKNIDREFEAVALFDAQAAEIRFEREGQSYSYKGELRGDGRWFLKCEENKRSASLYKSVLEDDTYEGTLYFSAPGQQGYRAMWYIDPINAG